MSKEYIEAFGRITLHTEYDNDSSYDCMSFEDDCKLVGEALERLEAIEKSKPSTALELIYLIEDCFSNMIPYQDWANDIEKYILKAQKERKALGIIKEKPFESADCINYLTINKNNSNMLDYKHYCMTIKDTLVEEEFNLLKEVLE